MRRNKHSTKKTTAPAKVPVIQRLIPSHERPDLALRLLAMVTDWIIVVPLLLLAFAIAYGFCYLGTLLGLYYPSPDHSLLTDISQEPLFQIWIWGVFLGYYVRGWTLTGQTFGLRRWDLKIQNQDQSLITITQALIRLLTATLGLGNLTILIDRQELLTLQDHMAKCEMVKITHHDIH